MPKGILKEQIIREEAAPLQGRGRKKEVGVLGSLEARMRGTEEPEPGCPRRGRRRLSGKAEAAPAAKRPNRAGRHPGPKHHLSRHQFFGGISLCLNPSVEVFIAMTMFLNF